MPGSVLIHWRPLRMLNPNLVFRRVRKAGETHIRARAVIEETVCHPEFHAPSVRSLDRQLIALDHPILQVSPPLPDAPIISVLFAQHKLVAPNLILSASPPYTSRVVSL